MALDLGKEISLSGLRRSRKKVRAGSYPEKTYMNFAAADRTSTEMRRIAPVAVLLVVVVVAFIIFGVFGFYGQVAAKRAELSDQQRVLADYEAQAEGYDDVLAEYRTYESTRLLAEHADVTADEALALVDEVVAPVATVVVVDFKDATLSLSLTDVSLQELGDLSNVLRDHPLVDNVTVSTAATEQTAAGDVTAAVVVTMVGGAS